MGRPSKRTPEREARLLEAIRGGATRKAAALYAGINQDTLYAWLARYSDFSDALTRVEAEVEVRLTAIIMRAASEDPRHAEWWLERRRPDDYARRDRLEVTLRQQAERLAGELGLDPEELIAEAERLVARRG